MVKSSTNSKSCAGGDKTLDNTKGISQFIELSGPMTNTPPDIGYFLYIKASDNKLHIRQNGTDTEITTTAPA